MKKLTILLVILLLTAIVQAQAPQSFKYQAIARDSDGVILTDKNISLRISIVCGKATNVAVYTETHKLCTSPFGLIYLEIGNGKNKSGDLSEIDWSKGKYYVNIEIDENGGTDFVSMGSSQLLSVPYALYAKTSGTSARVYTEPDEVLSTGSKEANSWTEGTGVTYLTNPNNVGIGTTIPASKLHVTGTGINAVYERNISTAAGPANRFYKSRGSTSSKTQIQSGDNMGQFQFWGMGDDGAYDIGATLKGVAESTRTGTDLFDVAASIQFLTTNTAFSWGERMRITADGDVGIGTTTPNAKVEINDLLRLTPTQLSVACTTNLEGSLYYDVNLKEYCYCDGTAWQQLDGGGYCECVDLDNDGYDICDASHVYDTDGQPADCDDNNPNINPGESDLCDGIDNDCNPSTADGSGDPSIGLPCDGPDADLCDEGTFVCMSGQLVCSDFTGDTPDLCDGVDNDCNPATADGSDEPLLGTPCDGPDSDLCEEGFWACIGGIMVCTDNTGDNLDVCDGVDNDCDPSSPDGSEDPMNGSPCDGPDSDLCQEGVYSCSGGIIICSDNTGDNLDVCDGLDNDCDPSSADGSEDPQIGLPCDGPDSDLCQEGITYCSAGALMCSDNTGNTLDLCDGVDNDCNSATADGSDEPLLGTPCDGPDSDFCEEGVWVCNSGTMTCTDNTGDDIEICDDGLDNDCDGLIDANDPDCNPPTQNPNANIKANVMQAKIGQSITFDASNSYDPDSAKGDFITLYSWDFDGDGIFEISSTNPTTSYLFKNPGKFIVSLKVTDSYGLTDTSSVNITISK